MSSVLRKIRRSKQKRLDRGAQVVSREHFEAMELDSRVQLIQNLTSIALMHISEVIAEEVTRLAGPRYAHDSSDSPVHRYGSNPGTVRLAGQ